MRSALRRRRVAALRFVGANMTWQWAGDAAALRQVAALADVLALTECRTRDNKPLDVAAILGPEWDTHQDLTGPDVAGSVIAVRIASGAKVRSSWLVKISDAGRGVQARYQRNAVIVEPDGSITELGDGHLPLKATGQKDSATRRILTWVRRAVARVTRTAARGRTQRRWIWMGDANQNARSWRRKIDAPHTYGKSPMVAAWSHGWGRVHTEAYAVQHLDHQVIVITRRTKKEKP